MTSRHWRIDELMKKSQEEEGISKDEVDEFLNLLIQSHYAPSGKPLIFAYGMLVGSIIATLIHWVTL